MQALRQERVFAYGKLWTLSLASLLPAQTGGELASRSYGMPQGSICSWMLSLLMSKFTGKLASDTGVLICNARVGADVLGRCVLNMCPCRQLFVLVGMIAMAQT